MKTQTDVPMEGVGGATPRPLDAWQAFLQSHAAVTRQMNVDLLREHDLTINDYEVLMRLNASPGKRMRRVDLANEVLLTASGITRLLAGLESARYVARETCETDGRVSYAKLTPTGARKLRAAAKTHHEGIDMLFMAHFSDGELDQLAVLLRRLSATSPALDCGE